MNDAEIIKRDICIKQVMSGIQQSYVEMCNGRDGGGVRKNKFSPRTFKMEHPFKNCTDPLTFKMEHPFKIALKRKYHKLKILRYACMSEYRA